MDNKILAVWGTGNICSRLMESFRNLKPVFFLDNDRKKAGVLHKGVKAIHPSDVKDWEGIYIIVALESYFTVRAQLFALGLKEKEDFIWYRDWLFREKEENTIIGNVQAFLAECRQKAVFYQNKRLIFSDFLSFDKGACGFVNQWNLKAGNLILFSEAGWMKQEVAESRTEVPVIELPELFWRNLYLKDGCKIIFSKDKIDRVKESPYLSEAARNLRMGYPDMAEGYEYILCYYTEELICELVRSWKPEEIILWNAFYAFHFMIDKICQRENLPVRYMEFGNIPGTIIVEGMGQMGKSWPARKPEDFLKIPVGANEHSRMESYVQELKRSRLNRNVQPSNNLSNEIIKGREHGCRIVFYAGSNDNASGMQPYTEDTQRYHSPVFRTSDEAAAYLAGICEQKGWMLVYKAHPMMCAICDWSSLPRNIVAVDNVDINELIDLADVVVTVLSTVSYIALIREKPVVMLGYTQLKEKGCTYEAFRKEDISEALEKAMRHSDKAEMYGKFIQHMVQLEKYYDSERRKAMQGE